MTAPLIEAAAVSKRFAGRLGRESTLALAGLSLAIHTEKPSIIAVVGESGSGKTTLARLLLGLAEPSGGEVRYRGTDLRRLGHVDRLAFRRDVQAIFQDPYGVYNPFYRVDHVLWTPVRRFRLAGTRAAARDLIGTALRAVGLRPEEILGNLDPRQLHRKAQRNGDGRIEFQSERCRRDRLDFAFDDDARLADANDAAELQRRDDRSRERTGRKTIGRLRSE